MLEPVILSALILAIIQVIKKFGIMDRWIPVIAIGIGILINVLAKVIGLELWELILGGLTAGLASCGLWDFGKKTIVNK